MQKVNRIPPLLHCAVVRIKKGHVERGIAVGAPWHIDLEQPLSVSSLESETCPSGGGLVTDENGPRKE